MYSIHRYIVPPGTGQNPRNLQDTRGTMARDIRYILLYIIMAKCSWRPCRHDDLLRSTNQN
jgi:hypothetical protein